MILKLKKSITFLKKEFFNTPVNAIMTPVHGLDGHQSRNMVYKLGLHSCRLDG